MRIGQSWQRLRGVAGSAGLSMPVVAIINTVILLITVTAISLSSTAREANRIDNVRTTRAIANAVTRDRRELSAIANDNAYWDEAAEAFAPGVDSRAFVTDTFLDSIRLGAQYSLLLVVGPDGRVITMVSPEGVNTSPVDQPWFADVRALSAQLSRANPSQHAIVDTGDGLRLIGASLVRPSTVGHPEMNRRTDAVRLIFSRRFSDTRMTELGNELLVRGLRRTSIDDPTGLALRNIDGRPIARVTWEPAAPGTAAVRESTPFLIAASIAALLAIGLLLAASIRTVRMLNTNAMRDTLSGMPNRRALRNFVRSALKQQTPVAVAFIDLDGFKSVNDSYGHAVGDALIRQCAALVQDLVPEDGLAVRLGGDEFALVTTGRTANRTLIVATEAILQRMTSPFIIGERSISIGASIGLSSTTLKADSESELMRQADIAMYAAKRSGKMRSCWFSPTLDEQRARAQSIEGHMRTALDTAEFEVHYQPVVDAVSGRTVALEALLRWDSDALNIGPDEFVPVAEETGLMGRLGDFALRRACEDAMRWPDVRLSVNISPTQLRNPGFPDQLAAILRDTGFPSARLELDITESYILQEPLAAGRMLAAVRILGVGIALDNFGTGHASIGFLRQFAFNTLKLDKSLVSDALGNTGARALVQACVAVARALDMRVVAEGIEDEADAVLLRTAGVDYLQGWHFSRAMPGTAVAGYLTATPAAAAAR
jgi:diguanylate cyclase (GGDEF)-like protein